MHSRHGPTGPGISATTTSTLLLASLRDEPNGAVWDHFVGRYRPVLVGLARAAGLPRDDAEDVAQETLVEFVRSYRAGQYQRGKGRLRSWLMGIVRHRLIDVRRRIGRRQGWRGESAILDLDEDASVAAAWDDAQQRNILREAMQALRTQTRMSEATIRAFELVALRGIPVEEAARQCEMTEAQVYVAKNRVASRLRQLVEEITRAYESDE